MINSFGENKVIEFFSSSDIDELTPYKSLGLKNVEFLEMWKSYLRVKVSIIKVNRTNKRLF
jgi:hypothetical protein